MTSTIAAYFYDVRPFCQWIKTNGLRPMELWGEINCFKHFEDAGKKKLRPPAAIF